MSSQSLTLKLINNKTIEYLHNINHQGSLTDINANTIKEITYTPYGKILNDTNQSLHVHKTFANGLYDKDTNLIRFGKRDYDLRTWTAKDPIDFSGGDSNLYRYVLGDPVNGVDPSRLVDVNLIPRDSAYGNTYLHDKADEYNLKNQFTIASHGYEGALMRGDVDKLAKQAKATGKKSIFLIACQQGKFENNWLNHAQMLANKSGLIVKYTRGNVTILPYFRPFIIGFEKWEYAIPKK